MYPYETIIAALESVPLFSELQKPELQILAKAQVSRQNPRNSTVIHDGDISTAIYIINKGRVKVCKTNEAGKEVVLAVLNVGEHFGEISLIDDKPRSASIVCKEACEFSVIDKSSFERVLVANPQLAISVMKGLCSRLRAADRSIESLALMDVYGRIARTLLDMAEEDNGKLVIAENLTHKEIAQMVGSSREMVSRILKDLSVGGYITFEPNKITINTSLPTGW